MDGVKRIQRGRGLRLPSVWVEVENRQMWTHRKARLEKKRTAGWNQIMA